MTTLDPFKQDLTWKDVWPRTRDAISSLWAKRSMKSFIKNELKRGGNAMTTLEELRLGIHIETILVENDELPLLVTFEAWKEPRLGWGILDITTRDGEPVFPQGDVGKVIDKAIREHIQGLERKVADG